jgi:DnaJ-class molecular chaperone
MQEDAETGTQLGRGNWDAARRGNWDAVLKSLKHKSAFKRDAILYRRMADTLIKFRGSAKKPLAEAKSADGNGGFFRSMACVVKASHPSKWAACDRCNGTGHVMAPGPDGKETRQACGQCHGAAYKPVMEV